MQEPIYLERLLLTLNGLHSFVHYNKMDFTYSIFILFFLANKRHHSNKIHLVKLVFPMGRHTPLHFFLWNNELLI